MKLIKFFFLLALGAFIIQPALAANRTINFSGYTWTVKSGHMGPGNNNWDNSEGGVFVDSAGNLHLKVRKINNQWYSSEVYLNQSLGYGTYEFDVAGRVDLLDKNLVVGLFTYADDEHEIDIEFSRWKGDNDPNLHYSVQPYYVTPQLNTKGGYFTLQGDSSLHKIIWLPEKIKFVSQENTTMAGEWEYSGKDNFVPKDERLHINFWMIDNTPPSDSKEKELVIKSFKFTPFKGPGSATSTVAVSKPKNTGNATSTAKIEAKNKAQAAQQALNKEKVRLEKLIVNIKKEIAKIKAETVKKENQLKNLNAQLAKIKLKLKKK